MKSKLVILFLSCFLIVACEETKSQEWWSEHIEEAKIKLAECKKSGRDSENCENVKTAVFKYDQLHAPIPTF